jgi:NTP pyrophosphatase (non-canonical NTP hydrolase)
MSLSTHAASPARSVLNDKTAPILAVPKLSQMDIVSLQTRIAATYLKRDRERGLDATFRWFTEEVGELARAIRTGERPELTHEFSDMLAWLASLANLLEIDLAAAMARYADGCPKCNASPCVCRMQ